MAKLGRWPDRIEHFMPSDAWEAHKSTLARELDDDRWTIIETLLGSMPYVRGVASNRIGQSFGPGERELVENSLKHAAQTFEDLTGSLPPRAFWKRMMGLEPTTFCMASAGGRSHRFA